ncbi:termination factor Rho [Lysinibacillus sphaericus]|uniref:Termination factor Rho n=1 Tax=Lysinibacillus sphaericus TaxID=1421 RepID=A0A544U7B6_LYSSH|nr:termination factor Rho [Lysinibacillus sp. SDF0037]TQR26847.1 termination factor Rho [Lysinibacillus sp. SDF0037]
MYKVVRNFKDKDGRFYREGDVFPAPDARKQTATRLKVLSSTNNSYGQIFIKKNEVPKEK